jgi:peptidoglycan/LPS O-acetylase OafA/YrhL
MEYLAMVWDGIPESFGLWMFLSIGAVALFVVFIPLVSWIDSRRKEREAFYKADTLRRLAEASGEGARAALDLLRGEERLKAIKAREGLKIGGLVNVGVGIGLSIMLYSMADGPHGPYLVGLIPALVGVALLVYVYVMAEPIERI